mmetsp:Transcript_2951/g.4844  ORF Transcript_2951/g.4844 Transcript_2951/m.4844 type:complete len:113 (-) Transcript_2951:254-592(-)
MTCYLAYIREAHASDMWPMKWAVEWPSPQSLDERLMYAKKCDEELGWSPVVEVLVDGMDDAFCHAFAAWPASGYVLGPSGRLLYVLAPENDEVFFRTDALIDFLSSLRREEQ